MLRHSDSQPPASKISKPSDDSVNSEQIVKLDSTMSEAVPSVVYKSIGTHSGQFHCDEAAAIFMLQQLPAFKNAAIFRSRDQAFLDTLDVLVDVGSVYDHNALRYDHHQRSFGETFSSKSDIKLSSAGLVYKHYGLEFLQTLFNQPSFTKNVSEKQLNDIKAILNTETWQQIYSEFYKRIISSFDAIDNGVSQYSEIQEPKYIDNTSISKRVARLNDSWTTSLYYSAEQKEQLAALAAEGKEALPQFYKAINIVGEELTEQVFDLIFNWLPAQSYVSNAVKDRFDFHPSGRIVHLPLFCPWKDVFFEQLKEDASLNDILFFTYEAGTMWRFLAVPVNQSAFEYKANVPKAWMGLRDAELDAASGVPGGSFVHHNGFTGGAKNKEALLQMLTQCFDTKQ